MRIAFYNIQNLFFRHQSLLREKQSRSVRNWIAEMDGLIGKVVKKPSDLNRLQELSFLLNFNKPDTTRYALLRQRGGQLHIRGMDYPNMEKACWTNRWNGWVEVLNYPLDPLSISNKARVIAETQADVLLLQEVEDRCSIKDFNEKFLLQYPGSNYSEISMLCTPSSANLRHCLLLKKGFQNKKLWTYSEEKLDENRHLFQGGCGVYEIACPSNIRIAIISVQFIKSAGTREETETFRLKQTYRVIEIYRELQSEGIRNILLMGTLNAYSYCHTIAPLIQETDLNDICRHPNFIRETDSRNIHYHRLGGYGRGINIRQTNYLMVSSNLFDQVEKASINRKAMWPGEDSQWKAYRSIKEQKNQASEFPLLWLDLKLKSNSN